MRNRFGDLLDTVEDYHSIGEKYYALYDVVMAMSRDAGDKPLPRVRATPRDAGDKPLPRGALVARNPSLRQAASKAALRLGAMNPATIGPAARRLLDLNPPDPKRPASERRPTMSTLVVTGYSDDLIEIDGDIREEFPYQGNDEDQGDLLAFSDGTILRIVFGGPWRISLVVLGTDTTFTLVQAPEDDDEVYSDKATLSGDISWVVHGIGWAK